MQIGTVLCLGRKLFTKSLCVINIGRGKISKRKAKRNANEKIQSTFKSREREEIGSYKKNPQVSGSALAGCLATLATASDTLRTLTDCIWL